MRVRDLWHRSKLGQILEGNQLVANDESAAKAFVGVASHLLALQLVGFRASYRLDDTTAPSARRRRVNDTAQY